MTISKKTYLESRLFLSTMASQRLKYVMFTIKRRMLISPMRRIPQMRRGIQQWEGMI
jgi:hypothetical protein